MSTPTGDPHEIASRAQEMAEKWRTSIQGQGWLFLSYNDELPYVKGTDPDTGWPLFNRVLWEQWYELDKDGLVTALLVRATDLDRGNVYRLAWQDGNLTRSPAWTLDAGPEWLSYDYRPINDHFCITSIIDAAELATKGTAEMTGEVTEESQLVDGKTVWSIRATLRHPPEITTDVTGVEGTYSASAISCSWSQETGVLIGSELRFVTDAGSEVLYQRTFDYEAAMVEEPPSEMLQLLEKLADANK
jgi:hypothetical protein